MGIGILHGFHGKFEHAALFCTTSDFAFGPIFHNYFEAESFIKFCIAKHGEDPRKLGDNKLEEAFVEHRDAIQAGEWPCPINYFDPPHFQPRINGDGS